MSSDSPTTSSPASQAGGVDPLAVCTLPSDPLSERMAWIRAEILPHAVASERLPGGLAWELADVPGLGAKLDRLVALERACCSGLAITHGAGASAGRRRIEVRGIDPEAAVFTRLAPPARTAAPPSGLGARIAKAAGLGTGIGLLVCCVFPIGVAAFLGAAAAAPFAPLDQPWVVAAVALFVGASIFAWESRSRVRPPADRGPGERCG